MTLMDMHRIEQASLKGMNMQRKRCNGSTWLIATTSSIDSVCSQFSNKSSATNHIMSLPGQHKNEVCYKIWFYTVCSAGSEWMTCLALLINHEISFMSQKLIIRTLNWICAKFYLPHGASSFSISWYYTGHQSQAPPKSNPVSWCT